MKCSRALVDSFLTFTFKRLRLFASCGTAKAQKQNEQGMIGGGSDRYLDLA